MARIQGHHIVYEDSPTSGGKEWVLELNMLQHRTISRVQITKATPQAFADLTNFMHAVAYEWNRMRQELDVEVDLRVGFKGKGKGGKTHVKKAVLGNRDPVRFSRRV